MISFLFVLFYFLFTVFPRLISHPLFQQFWLGKEVEIEWGKTVLFFLDAQKVEF